MNIVPESSTTDNLTSAGVIDPPSPQSLAEDEVERFHNNLEQDEGDSPDPDEKKPNDYRPKVEQSADVFEKKLAGFSWARWSQPVSASR